MTHIYLCRTKILGLPFAVTEEYLAQKWVEEEGEMRYYDKIEVKDKELARLHPKILKDRHGNIITAGCKIRNPNDSEPWRYVISINGKLCFTGGSVLDDSFQLDTYWEIVP